VETHEDGMSDWGEISENSTSEADFAEGVAILEAADPALVTANSGALSGLDKGMAQPEDAGKAEQTEIRVGQSKIVSRNCEMACHDDQRPCTEKGASGAFWSGIWVGLRAVSRP